MPDIQVPAAVETGFGGAFDLADSKVVKKDTAHKITPKASVEDGMVVVRYPLAEIARSRPSKVKVTKDKDGKDVQSGGGLGFMSEKVKFNANGKNYSLNAGWIGFKREADV